MIRKRRPRTAASWLAALALLTATLLPAITHALAAAGGRGWVEVCSAAGSRWVGAEALASAGDSAPDTPATQAQHCALCAVTGLTILLPAAAQGGLPVVAGDRAEPIAFAAARRSASPWQAGRPRGPPQRT